MVRVTPRPTEVSSVSLALLRQNAPNKALMGKSLFWLRFQGSGHHGGEVEADGRHASTVRKLGKCYSALFLLSIQSRPPTYGFVLSIVRVGPKAHLLG